MEILKFPSFDRQRSSSLAWDELSFKAAELTTYYESTQKTYKYIYLIGTAVDIISCIY